MPLVKIDLVPGLLKGDKEAQYKKIAQSVTDSLVENLNVPKEVVHVMIREFDTNRYAIGGKMFSDQSKQGES